ncbi:FAS1 domain-containing protein [Bombardia bombarda]|uniref:FAS1 domain-containing protein n=1 Tax=Bombardia bombarda TaxID=252184 RepID=A0AA39X234_9PEZI|nr:FAS1 domain-containing protein [Bombardia bombarda]
MFGLLPTALLAIISAFVHSPTGVIAAGQDLGRVLDAQKNLTVFQGLYRNHTKLFAEHIKNNVTIIAPNDAAFVRFGLERWNDIPENLVEASLKYHMLADVVTMGSVIRGESVYGATELTDPAFSNVTGGQTMMLTKQPGDEVVFTSGFGERGTVVADNVPFDGGLLQVIDSVMRVPERLETTARDAYKDLAAFLGALYATDLIEEFAEMPDVSIFAPHNTAFQQLAGTLGSLNKTEMKRILRYHIVPGNVTHTWELKNDTALATGANGTNITVTRFNNYIFVNSAQIIQTDILLANGIMQMIDNVLNPDQPSARPNTNLTSQLPVYTATGVTATGTAVPTPFTSELPCTASCPGWNSTTISAVTVTSTRATRTSTTTGGVRSTGANSNVAAARCTGLVGAGAALGVAMGALVVGL